MRKCRFVKDEKRRRSLLEKDEMVKDVIVQNGVYEKQIHLPFHQYILNKKITKIKEYLDVGYDVNVKDLWGRTALYYSIFSGNINVIKLLIQVGGDYNFIDAHFDGAGLLHLAAAEGYIDIVRYFVEKLHLDVNAVDYDGKNVLAYSMLFKQFEIAEYFIYHGVDYKNSSSIEDMDALLVYLLKRLHNLKKMLKNEKIISFEDISKIQKLIDFIRFYS